MQATYHIKSSEVNGSLMKAIQELFKGEDELTITVTSEKKTQPVSANEKEQLFYSLFGSWQGNETGDELVKQIYSDRVNSTRTIDL